MTALLIAALLAADPPAKGKQAEKPADRLSAATLGGLRLRSIGPAVFSGRIVGFAVDPTNRSRYFAAAASGGVWKTTNAGSTWTPVFENEGSYSIGCVVLDPKNPNVVWVGTGENNSQRSVGYGDGVYKSEDGGRSWKNVGLKASEHIGKILIDPRDSNVVYVAAQGPLWGPGGDRGLYKTIDGGKTWVKILAISENTGVTDVVLDAKNPDVLLCASYQRRRHVWTLVNGGPESAVHRSTDGGKTWNKVGGGLPGDELGRIGLAAAPTQPNVVYAIVESTEKKGGIFRSADFGVTWEKRNDFDQQAQYYSHLVVDPHNADRVYVMSVLLQVSDDGCRTLRPLGEKSKHVDNHEIWIDPRDPDYYLVGCDGGIYESFDRGANWKHHVNLPIMQFYDVTCDENAPFYNVYGGTQDNNTLGGPARNRSANGIANADWFVTQGGDGFHSRVDPRDPNTVYSEAQYGAIVRFDRKTGTSVGIQPQPGKGEPPLRWNWDSPLIISPHSPTRLYYAANILFRSDDRGDSWTPMGGDLTRQLDRDQLPVMGKIQSADAVSKHVSTSFYGNIVALTESPLKEGLLYVGTDDGLIQVATGPKQWRKVDKFPGVPERTYVSRLAASKHDAGTVYASFDNHKNADFKPYLLKSTDAGATWTSIAGDLPENGTVLAIAEDHRDPNLLFVGTEFGLYCSVEGGKKWIRLKGGLPTIAVRDLAIQKQMDDLVVGTFGRGIYILDDYSILRGLKKETFEKPATLFPARKALEYIQTRQFGGRGKGFLGETYYLAANPPMGATFTYYMKDGLKSKKQKRRAAEAAAAKQKKAAPYPTKDQLKAEAEEEVPSVQVIITDMEGNLVRTMRGPSSEGLHRVTWDMRMHGANLPTPRGEASDPDADSFVEFSGGPLAPPGDYNVALFTRVEGVATPLAGPMKFTVEMASGTDPAEFKSLVDFEQKVLKLERAVSAALDVANRNTERLGQIKRAIEVTPGMSDKWAKTVRELEARNRAILVAMRGDSVLAARNENVPPAITSWIGEIRSAQRGSMSKPTKTSEDCYRIASEEFTQVLAKLKTLVERDVKEVEQALDAAGAPGTPGRLPEWKSP